MIPCWPDILLSSISRQTLAQAFTGRIGLTPIGGEEIDLTAGDAVIATPRGHVREIDADEMAFVRDGEYTAMQLARDSH